MNEFDIDKLYLPYLKNYQQIVEEWPFGFPYPFPFPSVGIRSSDGRRHIEKIMQTLDKEFENFRADSKYLIAILFIQMLLFPILSAQGQGLIDVSNETLDEDIRSDLRTISDNAKDIQKNDGNQRISGHTVVSTIDRSWDQLNLGGKKKIWNDEGDKGPK